MKPILIALVFLSGCGGFQRDMASLTGKPAQTCFSGVVYLQFASGATIAMDINGKPLRCE